MIRVGDFSSPPFEPRRKFWLEKMNFSIEWVDFAGDAFAEVRENPLKFLTSKAVDGVLLPPEDSSQFLTSSARIPTEVREGGLIDTILRENGAMWIRCYLREAIHRLILTHAPKLDTHAIAYVTGSDAQARLCMAVAIQMGFSKITVISENFEQAQEVVAQLQKLFFSLDFKILRETELTLQPNNGSLLLNTLPAESGGVVFEDLTYLNFLRKEGLVVDLPISAASNSLLEEAQHVGIRRLAGDEIWGFRDWLFLQALGVDVPTQGKYLEAWISFLQEEKQT